MTKAKTAKQLAILRALGSPTRYKICDLLRRGDAKPSEIQKSFPRRQNIKRELQWLDEAGAVDWIPSPTDARSKVYFIRSHTVNIMKIIDKLSEEK